MGQRHAAVLLGIFALGSPAGAQIVTVNLDTAGNTWSYIVSYSFEPGQTTSLQSFYLPVSAPVSNIRIEGDDHGWTFETDASSFVRWFNPDPAPSADDIQSGEFMVFLIDSPFVDSKAVETTIGTWDNQLNSSGNDIMAGTVSPVPEPASMAVLGLASFALLRKWKT